MSPLKTLAIKRIYDPLRRFPVEEPPWEVEGKAERGVYLSSLVCLSWLFLPADLVEAGGNAGAAWASMGDITAGGSKWAANTAAAYRRNVAWFVAKLARNRLAVKEVDRSLSSQRRILATNTAAVTGVALVGHSTLSCFDHAVL
jgi:hypothetical protein